MEVIDFNEEDGTITFEFDSPEERQWYTDRAAEEGKTFEQFINDLLRDWINRESAETQRKA